MDPITPPVVAGTFALMLMFGGPTGTFDSGVRVGKFHSQDKCARTGKVIVDGMVSVIPKHPPLVQFFCVGVDEP